MTDEEKYPAVDGYAVRLVAPHRARRRFRARRRVQPVAWGQNEQVPGASRRVFRRLARSRSHGSRNGGTFKSLDEAERAAGPVTRLILGNHGNDSPPLDLDRVPRFPHLEQLALIRHGQEVLPDGIGDLSRLRFLDLDRSRLTSLPESIFDLPSLRSLLLGGNEFAVAPEGLRRMPALRGVRFDRNSFPVTEFIRLHQCFDPTSTAPPSVRCG